MKITANHRVTATYQDDNGILLTGKKARAAWKKQTVRCACGYFGDAKHAVCGTCYGQESAWLGCDNPGHPGQALGQPLIFRTRSQIAAINAAEEKQENE